MEPVTTAQFHESGVLLPDGTQVVLTETPLPPGATAAGGRDDREGRDFLLDRSKSFR